MLACVGGHVEVARSLIAAGANVRYVTPNGETALVLAERGNHAELQQLLRNAGPQVIRARFSGARAFGHQA
jgi:ankyrin repeat protein